MATLTKIPKCGNCGASLEIERNEVLGIYIAECPYCENETYIIELESQKTEIRPKVKGFWSPTYSSSSSSCTYFISHEYSTYTGSSILEQDIPKV